MAGVNGASHTHADDAVVAHVTGQAPADEDEEVLAQFYEALDADGQPVEGYKFDLFANDALRIKAAHLTSGRSAVVDGNAVLRLVMWVAGDGGARHG